MATSRRHGSLRARNRSPISLWERGDVMPAVQALPTGRQPSRGTLPLRIATVVTLSITAVALALAAVGLIFGQRGSPLNAIFPMVFMVCRSLGRMA